LLQTERLIELAERGADRAHRAVGPGKRVARNIELETTDTLGERAILGRRRFALADPVLDDLRALLELLRLLFHRLALLPIPLWPVLRVVFDGVLQQPGVVRDEVGCFGHLLVAESSYGRVLPNREARAVR